MCTFYVSCIYISFNVKQNIINLVWHLKLIKSAMMINNNIDILRVYLISYDGLMIKLKFIIL